MKTIQPPKFILTNTRLKITIILLCLVFIGTLVKADVPCQTAITSYEDSIRGLQEKVKKQAEVIESLQAEVNKPTVNDYWEHGKDALFYIYWSIALYMLYRSQKKQ